MFGDWELKVVSSTDNQCTVHKNPFSECLVSSTNNQCTVHKNPFSECLVTGNSKW